MQGENPSGGTQKENGDRADNGKPFIKGENGKTGWNIIRAEEKRAKDGNTINVEMNGAIVVPEDIFDNIKGRDVTITFDMGGGIFWSVDGKSITRDTSRDASPGQAEGIDFSVETGTNAIPADIIKSVAGDGGRIQLSLAHEGEFGFTAVLSINLGKENAGYTASLYYYNESAEGLEFICADEVAKDGTAELAFTHASDYVVAIDTEPVDEKAGAGSTSKAPKADDGSDNSPAADTKTKEDAWDYQWAITIGTAVIVAGLGIFLILKKKKEV